jgi:hypothetical protein
MNEQILSCIIDEGSYKRLQRMNDNVDASMSYGEFIQWNINCLYELTMEEVQQVDAVCQLIHNDRVSIVELEHCSQIEGGGIYFNIYKRLCICSGR